MLYYKETGEPFYSAGLLLPEVEIIGDKSKVNPWAVSGRHNTSSFCDPKYIGAEPFDIQYDLPFHIQDHKINIGLGRTPTPLENKIYPQLLQFHNSGKDINIKPSKRGIFTKAAKQHGMSVQGFANMVLRNPSKYSAAMRKKANFARNASKWNK